MRNRFAIVALCCLLPLFSACQTNQKLTPEERAALKSPNETFAKFDLNAEQLRESLLDKTILFYDPALGARVAYYNAEGKEYLWYPLRKQISVGEWKTEAARPANLTIDTTLGRKNRRVGPAKICFLYGKGVFNPVSRAGEGQWDCTPAAKWLLRIEEKADGDVFSLTGKKTPFRLNKRKTTIEELKGQCNTCKAPEGQKS